MGSNLASTARNVYSKKIMSKDVKNSIDSVSLLTIVNFFAFVMLIPLACLLEGERLMGNAFVHAELSGGYADILYCACS